jgi:uncharacterized membrane protein YfcA
MDWYSLLLVTFLAAALQAATGFGFGLIAVTMFVILMQTTSAVQIVIILTLAMSIVHFFKVRSFSSPELVKKLMLGCAVGYPIGIWVYLSFDLRALKIAVAALILAVTAMNIVEQIKTRRGGETSFLPKAPKYTATVGTISGVMSSALAMPGPVVMAYLTRCELTKDQIRATVIVCSTFSYAVAFALQMTVVGVDGATWNVTLKLLPAVFVGAVFGDYIAAYINPVLFKNITLVVLLGSGISMVANL